MIFVLYMVHLNSMILQSHIHYESKREKLE